MHGIINTSVLFLNMVIIKLFSCDWKIILLFYIYSSTKSILLTGNTTRVKRPQLTLRHRMPDLTGHMIIWGGLFAHGDGSTGLMKVVFCYALPMVVQGEPVLSRRRFARSACTWTVSNIPRLTKTLHQSYNDGMVNPVKQVIDLFLFMWIWQGV
jgi:hypothetical protein